METLQFINLSPSISPPFCFQNAKFLFTNYMHTCLLIILFFMTFGHSKLVRQQKCNYLLGLLSPPNRPFLLHRCTRISHRSLGGYRLLWNYWFREMTMWWNFAKNDNLFYCIEEILQYSEANIDAHAVCFSCHTQLFQTQMQCLSVRLASAIRRTSFHFCLNLRFC